MKLDKMASKSQSHVNASSLAELKAELARKQEEFKKDKQQTTSGYGKAKPIPKKSTLWSKQNVGVLQRAQNDLIEKEEEEDEIEKSKRSLEAKTKKYERMMSSNSIPDDEENETYLVDFQKKVVDKILENRDKQREEDKKKQQDEEEARRLEEEKQLLAESIPEPENTEEQWVDYVDSFGRSRRCLRKDLPHLLEMDKRLNLQNNRNQQTKSSQDMLPDLMSQDMYREKLRQKWEQEEQDALEKPAGPVHYANVQHDEIRTHGVGYYQFAKGEEAREEQMEQLSNIRKQTVELRAKKDKLKEKRKAIMEARLAKVKQRKMIREGKAEASDSAEVHVNTTDADDDWIGPKPSDKVDAEPEILVRDDAWRRDAPEREWDHGKKVIDDWRAKKEDLRDERLPEFAPPQLYFKESKKPSATAHKGSLTQRKRIQGKPPCRTGMSDLHDSDVPEHISLGLKELRNASELHAVSELSHVSSIPLPPEKTVISPSVSNSSKDIDRTSDSTEKWTSSTSGDSSYVDNNQYQYIPYQLTNYLQSEIPISTGAGAQTIYQGIPHALPVDFTQPPPTTPAMPQSAIPLLPTTDPATLNSYSNVVGNTVNYQLEISNQDTTGSLLDSDPTSTQQHSSEMNEKNKKKTLDKSAQVLKGTIHYSSKAVKYEVPQLPKPKYERVDLTSVPLNLPAPPSAGQAMQYPSQEEFISRKKDKEGSSIHSWNKQFNYKPQTVTADKIPFPAPNVQRNPEDKQSEDDIKFDPSKPPPNI